MFLLKIKPYFDKSTSVAGAISIIGFAGIALLCVVDVFLSVAFNSPILGVYEIIERTMLCAVFAAFAYAQTHKSHINMTILIVHLPRPLCMLSLTVTGLVSVGIAAVLTRAALVQAGISMANGAVTGMLKIPLHPFYYIEAIAMAFFTLILFFDALVTAAAIFNNACANQVREDYNLDNDVTKMTD